MKKSKKILLFLLIALGMGALVYYVNSIQKTTNKISTEDFMNIVATGSPKDVKKAIKNVETINGTTIKTYEIDGYQGNTEVTTFEIAAANTKYPEVIDILVKNGVKSKDDLGSGLSAAVTSNPNPEIFKKILSYDKSLSTDRILAVTLYRNSFFNPNPEILQELINIDEFREIYFSEKWRLVFITTAVTVKNSSPERLEIVLNSGVDINKPDATGKTAYEYIMQYSSHTPVRKEMLDTFLKYTNK